MQDICGVFQIWSEVWGSDLLKRGPVEMKGVVVLSEAIPAIHWEISSQVLKDSLKRIYLASWIE